MSAPPPGYSATASMLPAAGGTIHAMQGGGGSPYPAGPIPSLLPDIPGHILKYEGGGPENNAKHVAIASTVASGASAAPMAEPIVAPPPVPIDAPLAASAALPLEVPVAVAASAAQSANPPLSSALSSASKSPVDPLLKPIAVSVAEASHLSSSTVKSSIDILNGNPTAKAAIAAVSALAISNLKNDSMFDDDDDDDDDDDVKKIPINVFGREYSLPDPKTHGKSRKWRDVMKTLGLDALSDKEQDEFKKMIYEEPTCIEEDLLIGTAVQCDATRRFIYKVAKRLLTSPFPVPTGLELTFHNPANIEHLSKKKNKDTQEPLNEGATTEIPQIDEPSTKEKKPKKNAATTSDAATPTPAALQAATPKEGGLRKKTRRTIRKK